MNFKIGDPSISHDPIAVLCRHGHTPAPPKRIQLHTNHYLTRSKQIFWAISTIWSYFRLNVTLRVSKPLQVLHRSTSPGLGSLKRRSLHLQRHPANIRSMSATAPSRTADSNIHSAKQEAESVVTQNDPGPTTDASEKNAAVFDSIHIDPEDSQLIDELFRISKRSPKLIRSTVYTAPADPSITLRSWKMNEFKYYDVPSPFPTLARGLFTQEIKKGDQVKHRIVARGYDKFFNIGEVPWTHVCQPHLHKGNDDALIDKIVGVPREPHRGSVHPHPQIERLYHLHRRIDAHPTRCHVETLPGPYRQRSRKSRAGRRAVVAKAPRRRRAD